MQWSPSSSARAKSHCGRAQNIVNFAEHQTKSRAARAALTFRGLREGAASPFPGIYPLSTEFLIPVWIFLSESVFLTVTKWFMPRFSKQIKERDANIRARRRRKVSSMGSWWVFSEGETKLGLCKFKLGRTLRFLINRWILQGFYFISRTAPCKRQIFLL